MAGMSEQIRLIHPIYLDIPMLVSFAAAIEGGLSFGSRSDTRGVQFYGGGSRRQREIRFQRLI